MSSESFSNNGVTILAQNCSSSDVTIYVTDVSTLPTLPQFRLLFEDELMLVTAIDGLQLTVQRGIEGTTNASHFAGTPGEHILTAGALYQFKQDLINGVIASQATQGQPGKDAYSKLASDFIQPSVNGTVQVSVLSAMWMVAGEYVLIAGGGYYQIVSVDSPTAATVKNLGSVGNAAPGTDVPNASLVTPAGPSGATGTQGTSGYNAYSSVATPATVPAANGTVQLQVDETNWMAASLYVFVASTGYYQVVTVDDATHVTVRNLGYSGNAAAGSTISAGWTVTPTGPSGFSLPNPTQPNAVVQMSQTGVFSAAPITQDQILPSFSVAFSSGPSAVEVGTQVATPSFGWTTNRTPTSVVLTDSAGTPSKDVTATPSFTSNGTFQYSGITSVTFTLTATEGGPNKTATWTLPWDLYVYYGAGAAGQTSQSFANTLSKQLRSGHLSSFTVTATGSNKIYYIAPTSFGVPTFKIGGFLVTFNQTTVSYATATGPSGPINFSYNVYESGQTGLGSGISVVLNG